MTTTPELSAAAIIDAAVEQLLRARGDDIELTLAASRVAAHHPGAPATRIVVGGLLMHFGFDLAAGDPLVAYLTASAPDPHWRERHPVRPGSPWEVYVSACTLLGRTPASAGVLEHYFDALDAIDGVLGLDVDLVTDADDVRQ
jgi:hypothetical protein